MKRYIDLTPDERRAYNRKACLESYYRHRDDPEWRARQIAYNAERFRKRKRQLVELLGGKCVRCGFHQHMAALDFHHRDPSKKEFNIGPVIAARPWAVLVAEAQKCDLLCSNCHRILHWEERGKEAGCN